MPEDALFTVSVFGCTLILISIDLGWINLHETEAKFTLVLFNRQALHFQLVIRSLLQDRLLAIPRYFLYLLRLLLHLVHALTKPAKHQHAR